MFCKALALARLNPEFFGEKFNTAKTQALNIKPKPDPSPLKSCLTHL
jgi:hypothetical protein